MHSYSYILFFSPYTLGQYRQSNPKEYVEIVPHIKPGSNHLFISSTFQLFVYNFLNCVCVVFFVLIWKHLNSRILVITMLVIDFFIFISIYILIVIINLVDDIVTLMI